MKAMQMLKFFAVVALIILLIQILRLIEIYSQLSRYQKYWTKNNQQVIDNVPFDYVAFGDSAAQGVGATSPGRGYPGLIRSNLSKNSGKDVTLLNLSKSGGKVQDVLYTQLPAYEALHLKNKPIITMEIGANDMIDFNSEKFEKEMDELMSKLPKQTLISDIPYFGGTRLSKLESNATKANEIMYRLADIHDFKLVPLYDKIKNNTGLLTLAADLFHPSNKGYRENWAPVFLSAIESN